MLNFFRDPLVDQYLDELRVFQNYSPNTLDAYYRDLKWASDNGSDENQAYAFMRSLLDKRSSQGESPFTVFRFFSAIKQYLRFLIREELLESSVLQSVSELKIRLPKNHPEYLSQSEVKDILQTVKAKSGSKATRDYMMLLTMYGFGLRVSELCSLRRESILFEDKRLHVMGKGSRQRQLPFFPGFDRAFENYIDLFPAVNKADHGLFLNRFANPISRISVYKIVRQSAIDAGIGRKVYPHCLRHSYATHMLQGGANIREVQVLLGHQDISTTEIYTHLDKSVLRDTLQRYHPIYQKTKAEVMNG